MEKVSFGAKAINFPGFGRVFILTLVASLVITSSASGEIGLTLAPADEPSASSEALNSQPRGIWEGDVGGGFRDSVQTFSIEPGVAWGVQMGGGQQIHDIVLLSLSYGWMLGGVRAKEHWYRGNWEFRAELFGGAQFEPKDVPLAGLTPHIRYDFATGTRLVPFVDFGAGVTASGIGPPDQSGTFEFNLQGGIGTHWFLCDNIAVTGEIGYLHMSCAGLHDPNLGVNTIKTMIGITWFF